ncbi:MAG: glycoside hydrolase family 3 C-terminal domain-containing protein [Treponema sp.]|jgi:beta-glucosidase|nr:glycoside hydrolase family 3 C-terminal domain-containing protein [Treponema sp.]
MICTKEKRLSYTEKAEALLAQMSLDEKVYLMSGKVPLGPEALNEMMTDPVKHYNYIPYPNGDCKRLGIPAVRFCDGPRGVVCGVGKSTCFPVSMCRGASFDTELEEEIGRAIGREVRAWGGNLFAGVCINLPQNPGWGRSQESYGEESFAVGQMAAALVRGVQEENVMACIKHFAFNSMEISRFKVSVDCDRRTEREVFLPHFKDCVDAGAASIMSAYNRYKGIHCGHHDYLLKKVLKEEWDFDGFVMSDFIWGVKDTVEGANNGEDLEMCGTIVYGDKLVQAVKDGLVPEARIDEACLRLIRTTLAFDEAYTASYGKEIIGCEKHRALALRSAEEGITLLKNEPVNGGKPALPLNRDTVKTIALIGKLAVAPNIGDYGSSRVFPAYVVSPYDGICKAAPGVKILCDDGSDPERAKKLAAGADAAVFVVGFDHDDEGEYVSNDQDSAYTGATGGDRRELSLHEDEIVLLKTAGPANRNSVAVMIGGNTIVVTEWIDCVASLIMAFYPGQEGGTALARILFGDVNPSGKLPFVQPFSGEDLPKIDWDTTNQWYEYYHGYAKLEKEGKEPLYPYGYGLSYTTFGLEDAHFEAADGFVSASCTVTNTGSRSGTEVLQLYVGFPNSKVERPVKLLRGFKRVELKPGESKKIGIRCAVSKLEWYNPRTPGFELERMEYRLYIGSSSAGRDLLSGTVKI